MFFLPRQIIVRGLGRVWDELGGGGYSGVGGGFTRAGSGFTRADGGFTRTDGDCAGTGDGCTGAGGWLGWLGSDLEQ